VNASSLARKMLWRAVLTLSGGLRVRGAARLPAGPCVIVANHNSHADTAALIAALPASRQPAVAAAADYWFRGGPRPWACRALCGAFPVRRGGGSADLAAAERLLAAGRDVIVYPEGTRSRDGTIGEFHRGAARLAAVAGVPLVPAGISGTRTLLPPGAAVTRFRRAAVTVRIGVPLSATTQPEHALAGGRALGARPSPGLAAPPAGMAEVTAEARARVAELAAARHDPRTGT
jgi:1-acyl-sn-glycerol-3-phosphate acyltransferase